MPLLRILPWLVCLCLAVKPCNASRDVATLGDSRARLHVSRVLIELNQILQNRTAKKTDLPKPGTVWKASQLQKPKRFFLSIKKNWSFIIFDDALRERLALASIYLQAPSVPYVRLLMFLVCLVLGDSCTFEYAGYFCNGTVQGWLVCDSKYVRLYGSSYLPVSYPHCLSCLMSVSVYLSYCVR